MEVKIMFIDGGNPLSSIVKSTCGSEWSHSGILMFDGIVEAVYPKMTISPINKFDNHHHEIVTIHVTKKQLELMKTKAKEMIDNHTQYGFRDLFAGGIYTLFGKKAYEFIGKLINLSATVDCAEAVTIILRAGGIDILSDLEPSAVTPQELYAELKMMANN